MAIKTPTGRVRPDLVKPSKRPQHARARELWIHNPTEDTLNKLVKIGQQAFRLIPWTPAKRGENRVDMANGLAVKHEVHREVVYLLRRGYAIFRKRLLATLKEIGLHRLSVLLLAQEKARKFLREGVPDPSKGGKRKKAVRLYQTEELRRAIRMACEGIKRPMVPGGKATMKIVRGARFRQGPLKENLDRLLRRLDAGVAQAVRRGVSLRLTAGELNNEEATFKLFCEALAIRAGSTKGNDQGLAYPTQWSTAKTDMVDELQRDRVKSRLSKKRKPGVSDRKRTKARRRTS